MKYIAYVRVSTEKQDRKKKFAPQGMSKSAQLETIEQHMGEPALAVYEEVESGSKVDRPELKKALAHCQLARAPLVVAKLDRLARNASFVMALLDTKDAEFMACDCPGASRLMIQMLAIFAEYERGRIGERTSTALQYMKRQGIKLGNPNLTDHIRARGREVIAGKADDFAKRVASVLLPLWRESQDAHLVAARLNLAGIMTRRGKAWNKQAVERILKRLA